MERSRFGFDSVRYKGDIGVRVDGSIRNEPGSVEAGSEGLGVEPPDTNYVRGLCRPPHFYSSSRRREEDPLVDVRFVESLPRRGLRTPNLPCEEVRGTARVRGPSGARDTQSGNCRREEERAVSTTECEGPTGNSRLRSSSYAAPRSLYEDRGSGVRARLTGRVARESAMRPSLPPTARVRVFRTERGFLLLLTFRIFPAERAVPL